MEVKGASQARSQVREVSPSPARSTSADSKSAASAAASQPTPDRAPASASTVAASRTVAAHDVTASQLRTQAFAQIDGGGTGATGGTGGTSGTGAAGSTGTGDMPTIPPIDQHVIGPPLAVNACGATGLAMVLKGFGKDGGLSDKDLVNSLASEMNTDKGGTGWNKIRDAAEARGLAVDVQNGYTNANEVMAGINSQLDQGKPVMVSVGFNALHPNEGGGTTHWVVVTGHENGQYTINDPWTGKTTTVSDEKFAEALGQAAGIKGWSQIYTLGFSDPNRTAPSRPEPNHGGHPIPV